jgi:hypothetical protein
MKVPYIQSYDKFSVQRLFYNRPTPSGKRLQGFLRNALKGKSIPVQI